MDRRVFIKRAALGVVLASAGSPLALRAAAEELKQKVGTKPVIIAGSCAQGDRDGARRDKRAFQNGYDEHQILHWIPAGE